VNDILKTKESGRFLFTIINYMLGVLMFATLVGTTRLHMTILPTSEFMPLI
jgi:hypothetical protein